MNNTHLNDLEELALTVRDKTSRSYVVEAIEACQAGAYRSAIVSLWIAVTYDIIAKLRELAENNDKNAIALIGSHNNSIKSNDIVKLQQFENELLNIAFKEFELLSLHEFSDLERLRQDRNLCAHPAFSSEEALFEPEPERVRMHVVHAIKHLMQHQPIQGKAALGRLINDLKLDTFPSETSAIQAFLNSKYLNRAKRALVANLVVCLTKAILYDGLDGLDSSYLPRAIGAFKATANRHPSIYEDTLKLKLPALTESLDDLHFHNTYRLLGIDNRCWNWISEPTRILLKSGIQQHAENHGEVVLLAMTVDDLRPDLLSAFNGLDPKKKLNAIAKAPHADFAEQAIHIYSQASGYREAESLGSLVIMPMIPFFSVSDIAKILETVLANGQIWDAGGTPLILTALYKFTKHPLASIKSAWESFFESLSQPYGYRFYEGQTWKDTAFARLVGYLEQDGVTVAALKPRI